MIRTILLGVVVVLLGVAGSAAPPDPPPIWWAPTDVTASTRTDRGTEAVVEITKRDGTFRVAWIMDGGTVMGVGIYSNDVFAASYFGVPAVVVYKVDGDRLVGEWTMGGIEGAIYTETLTKTSSTVEPRAKPAPRPRRPQPDRDTPRERSV